MNHHQRITFLFVLAAGAAVWLMNSCAGSSLIVP
jgi:hypothetical protein